VTEAGM